MGYAKSSVGLTDGTDVGNIFEINEVGEKILSGIIAEMGGIYQSDNEKKYRN